MAQINYKGESIPVPLGNSVLHTLLAKGYDIPNSCRAGVCQSCLLQSKETTHSPMAQIGLIPEQIAAGFFLSCMCYPNTDLTLLDEKTTPELKTSTVLHKEILPGQVLLLRLSKTIDFKPGQFVDLYRPDGLFRSYSIASSGSENSLEFHIKVVSEGQFSAWAEKSLDIGCSIEISPAKGNCIYRPEFQGKPLLLAGIGTGMAPLLSILKSALAHDHQGPIEIYNGAAKSSSLYALPWFTKLAKENPQIQYFPRALENDLQAENVCVGSLDEGVIASKIITPQTKAFLCGSANTVKRLNKSLFLAGIPLISIFADPFS